MVDPVEEGAVGLALGVLAALEVEVRREVIRAAVPVVGEEKAD